MSSEYSFCSEGGFDELSSSSDSGFDVSFESPKHEIQADTLFPPVKEEKRKKARNTRCKSPTQVSVQTESQENILKPNPSHPKPKNNDKTENCHQLQILSFHISTSPMLQNHL